MFLKTTNTPFSRISEQNNPPISCQNPIFFRSKTPPFLGFSRIFGGVGLSFFQREHTIRREEEVWHIRNNTTSYNFHREWGDWATDCINIDENWKSQFGWTSINERKSWAKKMTIYHCFGLKNTPFPPVGVLVQNVDSAKMLIPRNVDTACCGRQMLIPPDVDPAKCWYRQMLIPPNADTAC